MLQCISKTEGGGAGFKTPIQQPGMQTVNKLPLLFSFKSSDTEG